MADDNSGTTSAQSQADNDGASQADTTASDGRTDGKPQAGTDGKPQAGDAETLSLDEARKLRREHQQLRSQLKEATDKLSSYEQSKLSEQEKLEKRVTDAEAERDSYRTRYESMMLERAVDSVARKHNVIDPEAVTAMLDKTAIERDKDGKPTNLDELVKDLVKAKPYLVETGVKRPGADGGASGGAIKSGDMNSFIRRGAGRPVI